MLALSTICFLDNEHYVDMTRFFWLQGEKET